VIHRQPHKKYLSVSLATALLSAGAFAVIAACSDQQAKAKPVLVHKEAPKAGVVAKIGNEEITEEQLIGDGQVDFFEIKKREYELKMERLNKMMVDKLVGAEAKKAGMSTEDFISKKIVGGEVKVTDKMFKDFVKEKRIPEGQITPQIKERINAYIQGTKKQDLVQAYVAKLTKGQPVEVYFKKPKMDMKVEAGDSPSFGSKDAPIQVVEFSDFQCPFCARGADLVHELKKRYGKKLHFSFKQFPLPMHKEARPASEAALCVNELFRQVLCVPRLDVQEPRQVGYCKSRRLCQESGSKSRQV